MAIPLFPFIMSLVSLLCYKFYGSFVVKEATYARLKMREERNQNIKRIYVVQQYAYVAMFIEAGTGVKLFFPTLMPYPPCLYFKN